MGRLDEVYFSDLVHISGMVHGTDVWYDNGENLLAEHPFHELIGDRNDISAVENVCSVPLTDRCDVM